ncbi:MAG: hypothetical protein RLZZ338_1161 [Cyanobacteriota bacterium]|jgi:hypothetical protein
MKGNIENGNGGKWGNQKPLDSLREIEFILL